MTGDVRQEDIRRIVIVGAGLAGANAAEELRASGFEGEVVLVGAEEHPPYERPPLSKEVLLGRKSPESSAVHPPEWYVEQRIELLTGTPATGLDLADRRLVVEERTLEYDRLLLAMGSSPRHLPMVDESGVDVVHLRTVEDAIALKERLDRRLLVVGGGWVGLEVAAAARLAGGGVTVVEAAPVPLGAVLGPELAQVFADEHRRRGVDLRTGTTTTAIRNQDGMATVSLSDGTEVTADAVVVGIGAAPDTGLALAAGLPCDNGVLVDATLRTSDPHVFAAGDVANHDHPTLGRVRVEHWDNAIQQGRHAARNMLGAAEPYQRQPYFFTDQYDLGMEYVGHVGADGFDEVRIGGDPDSRVFTAFWVRSGTVVAGMHVGDWDAIDRIRELVGGPARALSDQLRAAR